MAEFSYIEISKVRVEESDSVANHCKKSFDVKREDGQGVIVEDFWKSLDF